MQYTVNNYFLKIKQTKCFDGVSLFVLPKNCSLHIATSLDFKLISLISWLSYARVPKWNVAGLKHHSIHVSPNREIKDPEMEETTEYHTTYLQLCS